jgi:hypothetical protein
MWVDIRVSHLFEVPILVSWVGLEKSKELKLDVQICFGQGHISSTTAGDALTWCLTWCLTQ